MVIAPATRFQTLDGWMLIMDGDPLTWAEMQYFFGPGGTVRATHAKCTFPMRNDVAMATAIAGLPGTLLDPAGSQTQAEMLQALGVPVYWLGNFTWNPPGTIPSNIVEELWDEDVSYLSVIQTPAARAAWGAIFADFLSAAAAAGLNVWGISIQNEPDMASQYAVNVAPATYGLMLAPGGPLASAIAGSPTPSARIIAPDVAFPSSSANYAAQLSGADVHRWAYHAEIAEYLPPPVATPIWQTEMGGTDAYYSDPAQQMTQALARAEAYHRQLVDNGIAMVGEWTPWCSAAYIAHNASWRGSGLWSSEPDGKVMQKKGWAFVHYSRWIRPGAVRIACTGAPANVLASAYENTDGSLVLVVVNKNATPSTFAVTGFQNGRASSWLTSETVGLAQQPDVTVAGGSASLTLPARSIATVVQLVQAPGPLADRSVPVGGSASWVVDVARAGGFRRRATATARNQSNRRVLVDGVEVGRYVVPGDLDEEEGDPMPSNSAVETEGTLISDAAVRADTGVAANRCTVTLINTHATHRLYVGTTQLAAESASADYVESNGGIREWKRGSAIQIWVRRQTGAGNLVYRIINEFF
jgi:hypothetical protein